MIFHSKLTVCIIIWPVQQHLHVLLSPFFIASTTKKRQTDGDGEGRPAAAAAPRAGGMRRRARANRMVVRDDSGLSFGNIYQSDIK